jgi:SAM-dependent methyltransferase
VDNLYLRRATSFGEVADEYARHRPGYPDEAVAWALATLTDGARVLDLAAGTGKLTEAVLRCGVPVSRVVAVEPDGDMRAELSRLLPAVRVLPGSAERIPAGVGTVDAVLVGQAFHWFDPDRALPEIARVLRPGGVLAALDSVEDDSVPWVVELNNANLAARPDWGRRPGFADVPEHAAFGERRQRVFGWRWPRTIDSLIQTVSTHSWVLVSEPEERDTALGAIRRFLEQHPATREGAFELPMQTLVLRIARAG